ncbi:MAG: hypothetical protein ACE5EW_05835, partial [Thermoplasmata archaeon]
MVDLRNPRETGPFRTVRLARRSKLALLAVAVLIAGTALGLVSNTLSPVVSRDIPTVQPNITLTVAGVPSTA